MAEKCRMCEEPLDHFNSRLHGTVCDTCKQKTVPHVTLVFDKATHGYWDGKRIGGHFTVESINGSHRTPIEHPGPGKDIRWGSWALNFYFTAKSGRSWKEAASIAARRLSTLSRTMKPRKITVNYGKPESFVKYYTKGATDHE